MPVDAALRFAEMDEEPERSFQTPRQAGLVRLLGSDPNAEGSVTSEIIAVPEG
ncbi:hypothetical protein [Citricoccus sp. GCM10030269]|uniref:hypothetical protein n=1 Tax=Citricoccus sp. GCM10030269 TaxID=3273388 RepID=UPI0036085867